ncbi:GNAT family N-acetyltransferase [Streptomyces mobaraensis NBRC 13819 = DSM 40847]|uniref:Acyl-CoA synthetase n=1 Tax=Streptomyces mobaraensis (strain ATCC 29032 / DSM 40847 / JCM 4168 / NBRC 13819 / NCIMB 11159 / IPCR 16-22) TaxID=1223523 RepID=M3A271_STRM1|nr:bifunctional GNAT family N-acetyltransferase/acetate--CoA ligase family protein [Streptomyces mobaraensis]EME99208.1 acyl-CoA synthetase [Streptomyces mobaraensis NBRC 13819 = DSM 40847]QTT72066.1 GNAT family N-acetyltransferase [Streptomyces mobaraensis NBRC 13819 = DSM 40847]
MTRAPESPAGAVYALLADGTTVRVRPVGAADRAAVLRLYEHMSPANLRLRFFSSGSLLARRATDALCRDAGPGDRALLAETADDVVGIAEYHVVPADGPATAEAALAVADEWHHRGVGTLLLEHLVDLARAAGVRVLTADALSENLPVIRVFADLGLPVRRRYVGSEIHVRVALVPDERYLDTLDARGRTADVASLRPLLRPRSVAVVGAGHRPGSVGRAILRNLRANGFTGPVHVVNPHGPALDGLPCHPSVAALPDAPDLAVLAVPAPAVPAVAEECGARGVRALAVVTAGLDADQAAGLRAACRRHGMRLVGPNCLGLANRERDVRLDATFAARFPLPGTAGVATQSGGVGIALLDGLSRLGIGASTFVSLGDKYDVSGNDLLQWWEEDGRTDLAVLHLESFGNPRAFSRTARRVSRRMPVLTVDAGRSEAGRRAAASHTAAAATPTMTRQALFHQAGVIATRTIGELLDTVALLHTQPLPAGDRVVVVTNAGGVGVLAADACVEAGLSVRPLEPGLAAEVAAVLPEGAAVGNPVDTTAAVPEDRLRACVDLLAAHRDVDMVLGVLVPTALGAATGDDPVRAFTHAPDRAPRTTALVLVDRSARVESLPAERGGAVPVYTDAQDAARALAYAAAYARRRSRPQRLPPEPAGIDVDGARADVAAWLAERPEGGWLDPVECARLLGRYGIPQVDWEWVCGEEAAVAAAARLAGPDGRVVLKAHWPGLVHKTAEGAVRLDLQGEARVRSAYRDLADRFGDRLSGVVAQPQAPHVLELVAGVVQDPVFGPLVLFGQGGTATDVLADHAARLAPLTAYDLDDLITAPRCSVLLSGRHGGVPVNLEALERLLLCLSRMACDLPELAEADLNPVVPRPDGVMALDARVRLAPHTAYDPYLRRLR